MPGEDGSWIEFTDKNGNLVFWYEQGEKWRVDMEQDEHAYEKQLREKYKSMKMEEFKSEKVNGIEMIKIVFHLTDNSTLQLFAFFELKNIQPPSFIV